MRTLEKSIMGLALAVSVVFGGWARDAMRALPLGRVDVGGEIGRRIDITITNNLYKLEVDRDFLEPFRNKTRKGASIGLGKLIEQATRLAAYDRREKTRELRRYIVTETLKLKARTGTSVVWPKGRG